MSRAKGKVKPDINTEMRRLQKALAVLIAIQAAADDGTFDVADALAVVIPLVRESIAGLDRLEVQHGRE